VTTNPDRADLFDRISYLAVPAGGVLLAHFVRRYPDEDWIYGVTFLAAQAVWSCLLHPLADKFLRRPKAESSHADEASNQAGGTP